MVYKGTRNMVCPVCKKTMTYGHPVMYRVNNVETRGHLWCPTCFTKVYSQYTTSREADLETFQSSIKDVVDKAHREITDRAFPAINGFWFCYFENHNLGLVINYAIE